MGCGISSPRFRSSGKQVSPTIQKPSQQPPRFTSREAEEEQKEDDKKVHSEEIETITKGSRNFRTEKNTAIKPLDQSKMMREISKYMGTPYVQGGTSSEGIDCSGYTMLVYKNAMGIQLPRSSTEQFKTGTPVEFSDLKFGDLVFFNTNGTPASHVGIYLGDDLFAHASVSLGVTISSLQSTYYSKRYCGARRIIE
ncbi:MAG: C40 family peptidase [Bacteroidetes bacterium]|nr:C40 family peptidase [Bacteroidota bacterium]